MVSRSQQEVGRQYAGQLEAVELMDESPSWQLDIKPFLCLFVCLSEIVVVDQSENVEAFTCQAALALTLHGCWKDCDSAPLVTGHGFADLVYGRNPLSWKRTKGPSLTSWPVIWRGLLQCHTKNTLHLNKNNSYSLNPQPQPPPPPGV